MKTQLAKDKTVRHILSMRCNESGGFTFPPKDRKLLFSSGFHALKNQSSIIADLHFYSLNKN